MELMRGNNCAVDNINNIRTRYLINDASILVEKEPRTAAMTDGVSGRGGGPIPLVSGCAIGTKGKLTVYNQQEGGGATNAYTPMSNL